MSPSDGEKLDKDYLRDLSAQILSTWTNLSIEGLVDTVGSERASEAIRPHTEHSGHAAFLFLKQRMGWKDNDMETVSTMLGMAHLLLRKKVGQVVVRGDEEGIVEFVECPFVDSPPEMCKALCFDIARGVAAEANPDFEGDLPKAMKNGDAVCQKHVFRKSSRPGATNDWRTIDVDLSEMSEEERDWFFSAYIGEFWLLIIRAFNDVLGEEGTWSVLAPRMKAAGMSLGLRLVAEHRPDADLPGAESLVEIINKALHRECTKEGKNDIVSCPFNNATSPACYLIEAFMDGLSQAVDPDLEFTYTSMVAKGERSYHWVVRRRGESPVKAQDGREPESAPLEVLRMRLARGEITKEEFAVLKDILSRRD